MPSPAAATTPGPDAGAGARVIAATPTPGTRVPAARRATRTEQLIAGTASFVEETPVPDTTRQLLATLQRSKTLPLPALSTAAEQSPSAVPGLRKRKRQASSSKSVPEAAQIFRNLSFYYIPNNDIAPARKLRIGKAQEYGARWVRNLADASHVVVDKNLTYKDIEGLLGCETAGSFVIVNEEYPIDCISFRTLLNPDQNRYKVPGCPILAAEPAQGHVSPVLSQSSDRSLQLKPAPPSRRQGPANTPSGSDQPSRQSETSHGPEASGDQTTKVISDTPPSSDAAGIVPASPTDAVHPQPRRGSSTKDELTDYIELMQQYKHLPLDAEEEDLQSVVDAQEALSDSEVEERSEDERIRKKFSARARRTAQKEIPFEERFACNRGGTKDKSADAQNPNARTIEVLQSMCDYYTRINDNWRTLAYRKAIATLRRQSTKIMTEEEAYRLPNIGRRLAAKIEEIACTNKLRRLEYANDEPLDQVLETFLKIYDVGTSRANKWIAQGFRTLDDLLQRAELTPNQRIGIERYDDLNTRIPRAEVTALFEYVKREAAKLDPHVELLVGGSYRRGSDSSGDIDIIVTKKGTSSAADLVPFLEDLVAVLTRKGFLVATLAALHAHRPGKDGPGSKWHGCCVLPREGGASRESGGDAPRPIWRRIDFLLVPESEYGAALIYFTGNDIFNRSMRLLASKKGMRLNQRGLYKEVMRGKNSLKVTEGELLEGRDEKRIFELLGVKWREPWERWC
ncbi:ff37ed50-0c1f-47b6-98bd-840dba5cdb5e [Thermothielavioides terrestris]|uniref:DNA polymerase lambda n=1 Tax=Thermothielavioides terrestris TaxID=2587410 RepID=A0A3S4AIX1_9PEZI|nr:ff37ed50-0c1f-47b6-98bd-840dba5cdb5e [Thermothielavioides terrestris]